jgi:glycerate dehydrogenase
MQSIVFLDRATLAPGVRLRRPAFAHRWIEHGRTEPSEVAGRDVRIVDPVRLRAFP